MQRFKKTIFGMKEDDYGLYTYAQDMNSEYEHIFTLKSEIEKQERIIKDYGRQTELANDTFNAISEILVKSIKTSKARDQFVREIYGISEDFESVTIYMEKGRKTTIDISKKTK